MAAGLTDEFAFRFDFLADGFAVSNLRLADRCVNAEFAFHTVNDDVQVKFAHAGDDGLIGFRIGVNAERRIFFSQTLQCNTHLFLVSLGLRFNGYGNNRIREYHLFQNDRSIFIAERIACGDILEAYRSSDVAGVGNVDFLAVICVHLENAAYTFLLAFGGIQNVSTLVHFAGIYAEICELAHKGVSHDLECKSGKRSLVVRRAFQFFFRLRVRAFDSRYIQRGREVIQNSVKQHLNALVLVCGAAKYREYLAGNGLLAESGFDFLNGEFFAAEVFFHESVVCFSSRFTDHFAVFFHFVFHIVRNFRDFDFLALVIFVNLYFSGQKIDDADESAFLADRQLHSHRISMQAVFHRLYGMQEIRAYRIHFVDECDTRYMIGAGLSPDRFRLGLYTIFCAEYSYGAV